MMVRSQCLYFVFSSKRLNVCLCRQPLQKSVSFSSVDAHGMQMVIIEDAVVYPFAGCAVFIDFFVFPRAPGNWRIKAGIPGWLGIDAAPIWGFRAAVPAWAGIHFPADQRAAPLATAAASAVAPVYHPVSGLADRGSVVIDFNFIRNGLWPAAAGVQVNKRPDIPRFTEIICGIVVICGIKTQVLDGNAWI